MKTVREHVSQWALDQSETTIEFQIRHMVVTTVNGKFSRFAGTFNGDPADLEDSSVKFSIESDSVDTRDRMRDRNLRGEGFFNAAEYPRIQYESTSIENGDDGAYTVRGVLRIKEVEREVELKCRINGTSGEWFSFNASGKVKSADFGLKWKSFFDPGNVLVGSTVKIIAKGTFRLDNAQKRNP